MEANQQEAVLKKYHFFRAPWLGTSNQFRFREKKMRVYGHTRPVVNFILDPEMPEEFRHLLTNHPSWHVIGRRLTQHVEEARYRIGIEQRQYYLRELKKEMEPIFGLHSDPGKLIRLADLVANWQFQLESNNQNSSIDKQNIDISFELLQGVPESDQESATGEKIVNPDSLSVEYINGLAPAFRCGIAVRKERLYVAALHLDSVYGIQEIDRLELIPGEEPKRLSQTREYHAYHSFSLAIPKLLTDMGRERVTEYLNFIFSTKPLDISVLTQNGFNRNEAEVSTGTGKERILDIKDADWMAYIIPVQIIFGKPSFEQIVEKLNNQTPVYFFDDPQKDRWGGKSYADGLELRAEIKAFRDNFPSLQPVYPLTVSVISRQKGHQPSGKVAFFLHDSFAQPFLVTQFENGRAAIEIMAVKAFTVGAYTEDGTRLELDMNNVKGYPPDFYDHPPMSESPM